jgi:hypothetical protein
MFVSKKESQLCRQVANHITMWTSAQVLQAMEHHILHPVHANSLLSAGNNGEKFFRIWEEKSADQGGTDSVNLKGTS